MDDLIQLSQINDFLYFALPPFIFITFMGILIQCYIRLSIK